jgi:hypothetical protein
MPVRGADGEIGELAFVSAGRKMQKAVPAPTFVFT